MELDAEALVPYHSFLPHEQQFHPFKQLVAIAFSVLKSKEQKRVNSTYNNNNVLKSIVD